MRSPFHNFRLLAALLPFSFLFMAMSCGDDPEPNPNNQDPVVNPIPDSLAGKLNITFEHTVDGHPLEFNSKQYTNAAGNTYNVTLLKYYISNVTLSNSQTGKIYKETNSYHLIDALENKTTFTLARIPVKEFDRISFAIGVDSVANKSTDQPGDLNPNNDMAWDWNTGYIFMKFEGNNLKPNPTDNRGVLLHIGQNTNYKVLSFPINEKVVFAKDKPFNARVNMELSELFKNPNTIDFNTTFNVMGGQNAVKVANNYGTGMFSLLEIKP